MSLVKSSRGCSTLLSSLALSNPTQPYLSLGNEG